MRQNSRLLTGIGILCLTGCWSSQEPSPKAPRPSAEAAAPPALSQSKYRNTKPDVAYVGDAKCADCHEHQAQTYGTHPMGQSMREIQSTDRSETDGSAA